MIDKNLNIISFDVPYPPDYGGVIDIYYKIKALSESGVSIHLHCFSYGRNPSKVLEDLCATVYYYDRNVSKSGLFNKLPYIIVSRTSGNLVKNLLKNDYPILFEGIHTCKYIADDFFSDRLKFVRTHNIEHEYYENLALVERNIFKRYYFHNEAEKLKSFEEQLNFSEGIIAISPNDTEYFQRKYSKTIYIPAFHPNDSVLIKPGKGNYALYHGNLSIGENDQAARFLVNEVFSKSNKKLIIAGSKPSLALEREISRFENVEMQKDISTQEIQSLIRNAQFNILPTFQPTGIKLKLLFALFNGRHCIVNSTMVDNTGLETLCHICNEPQEYINKIEEISKLEFTDYQIEERGKYLNEIFSNVKNAEKLIKFIFKA